LLRVISGQLEPQSGRVVFDGADVTLESPSRRVRRGMCHIPDPRGIFPSMTVRDNLILQAPRGAIDSSVERAVAVFPKLSSRLAQIAGTLSGGEQQMLAVARAYVQQPRLVLLDEVSMGLAPNVVDEIFAFLDQLRSDGVALVLVEQFVHRAMAMAEQIAVVGRGKVVAQGPAADFTEADIFDAYAGTSSFQEARA
jgi:branched-chain amino acid transport system ATP-binding protein